MWKFKVTADIMFASGTLAGDTIKNGIDSSFATREVAEDFAETIGDKFLSGETTKPYGTQSRYYVVSRPTLTIL